MWAIVPFIWINLSAVDFLLTPGMQRVLGRIYANPGRSFTLNELLATAATGKGSTQQQIDRLVEAGVLREEPRRGRQRSIKANTDYFLYTELRSIAQKSFGLAEPVRDALAPYAGQILEAFVFGSVVRGTDSHQSDIDLIVVGDVSFLDLTQALLGLEPRVGRPVHLNLYAPDEWLRLTGSDSVLAQIAHGPRIQILPHEPAGGVRQPHQGEGT